MVDSGLNPLWQDAMLETQLTRNELAPLPGGLCKVKKGMFPDFAHLVAGHGFTSTQKDEKRVNIRRELLKQSILDLSPGRM